jgi:hypothetical protein
MGSVLRLYSGSLFVVLISTESEPRRLDQTGDRIGELSRRRSEFRESAVQAD